MSTTKDRASVLDVRGELYDGSPCVSVYYETDSPLTFRVKLVRSGDESGYTVEEWSEVEFVGGRNIRTHDIATVPPVVRGAVDGPVQVPER